MKAEVRLENVEAVMAELEIDNEDVHDRKKWRRNVMKRKSNAIGIRTIIRDKNFYRFLTVSYARPYITDYSFCNIIDNSQTVNIL